MQQASIPRLGPGVVQDATWLIYGRINFEIEPVCIQRLIVQKVSLFIERLGCSQIQFLWAEQSPSQQMFYTSPSLKFYCHYQLSIILLSNMKKEEPTVKDEQGEPKSRPICMEGFERSMRQKQRNERKCKSRQYLQGFPPIVRQLENFTVRNSKYELLQKYSNELREDYFRWVQDSRKCEGCQNYINKIHLRYQALRSSLKYLLVNPTNDARQIAKIIIEIFDQLQEKRFCDEEDEEDETKMQIERRSRSRSRQNKKNRKRQVNKGKQKRRSNSSAEDEADE